MSIERVDVMNAQGNLLSLSLEDISNGYVVKEIGGLDPVKASIVSSNFATIDGQQYQNTSRETRNITISLGYEPDPNANETIRGLRSGLYQFFMTGLEVKLTFYMTDGLVVNTAGRVESMEAPLWASEPQTDISIICMDPDFIGDTLVEIEGVSSEDFDDIVVNYTGTVRTGFQFWMFPDRSVGEFTIYNQTADSLQQFDFSAPLVVGDELYISTVAGDKYARLFHDGSESSVLYGVNPQAAWLELKPGPNTLQVNMEGDPMAFTIKYNNRYGGL